MAVGGGGPSSLGLTLEKASRELSSAEVWRGPQLCVCCLASSFPFPCLTWLASAQIDTGYPEELLSCQTVRTVSLLAMLWKGYSAVVAHIWHAESVWLLFIISYSFLSRHSSPQGAHHRFKILNWQVSETSLES